MKVCKACGGSVIQAKIKPGHISIHGSLKLESGWVVELQEKHKIKPLRNSMLKEVDIELDDEFDPANLDCYENIRCSNCGSAELGDRDVCPNCREEVDAGVFCSYESRIVCHGCLDTWACRNECNLDNCPLHPQHKNPVKKPRAKAKAKQAADVKKRLDNVAWDQPFE